MIDLNEFDADGVQTQFAITGGSETREERLARWVAMGVYDPECARCRARADHPTLSGGGGPGHKPSSMCRSGSRPHCSCDACF